MTETTSPPLDAPGDDRLPSAHKRLIALLVVATFVVILNETIMSVALPHLMDDLDIAATTAQWLTTGFLLTMAVVIPVTGFMLQRFHVRQVYLAAMVSFLVGTLIAALAPGFGVLLVGRIVQAVGTAIMLPLLMTTVITLVPESRRGQTMGMITVVIAVAPAIGPTISGLVLNSLDWRWMFWTVLPFAVAALILGALWVRNVTTPRVMRIDMPSVVLSALAFSGIVYGLSAIGEAARGETPVAPWIPLTIGGVALLAFVVRQLRLREASLLDLRAFATPTFTIATLLIGVSMMGLFGAIILIPLYLQDVRDYTTLTTGLVLLPGGLTMGLLSPIVGRIYDSVGPRPLTIPASLAITAALGLMATLGSGSPLGLVIASHMLLCGGLAFMFTPLLTTALGSLPAALYSHGSAIVSTLQQVAAAAGTAIFITVMTRKATSVSPAGASDPGALGEGIQLALTCGAAVSAVAIVVALFVRRPPPAPVAAPAPAPA